MKQAAEDNAFENSECYEGGRGMRKKKANNRILTIWTA